MNEFDIKAAEWDKDQMHWDRSAAIASDIKKHIPLQPWFTAMEFGAGTGLLSFMLRDDVKSILLVDNSAEMIRQADERIRSSSSFNLITRLFDLEHSDLNDVNVDLIFTQMVLHHIADVSNMLGKLSRLLNTGGYLAIADLYEEDGTFHGEGFNGHKGFNPDILAGKLFKTGFTDVKHFNCFGINRKITDTLTKQFDMFLMIAKKP